jgi:hypothetical protein
VSDEEWEPESRVRNMVARADAWCAAAGGDRPGAVSQALMAGFGLSIPLFFVTTYAWLLWSIVPPLAVLVNRLRSWDGRGPGAGQAPA